MISSFSALVTALCYHPHMLPKTPADAVGTGAPVALSTILGVKKCKWFQVIGTSISAVPGRLGDSGVSLDVVSPVSVGRGIPIGGQFAPPIALAMEFYDLTAWFLIMTIGDTASVSCVI
jgi:hypothetical protein